jgi:hypothetical protein
VTLVSFRVPHIFTLLVLVGMLVTFSRLHAEYICPEDFNLAQDGYCHPRYTLAPNIGTRAPRSYLTPVSTGGFERGGDDEDYEIGVEDFESDDEYAGGEERDYSPYVDFDQSNYSSTPHNRVPVVCFPSDTLVATMCDTIQRRLRACGIEPIQLNYHNGAQVRDALSAIYPPLPPETLVIIAGHGGNTAQGVHYMAGTFQTAEIAEGAAAAIQKPQVYVSSCNSGGAFNTQSANYDLATSSQQHEYTNYHQELGWIEPATDVMLNVLCDQRWFNGLNQNQAGRGASVIDGNELAAQLAVTRKLQTPLFSPNFKLISPHTENLLTHEPNRRRTLETMNEDESHI